MCASEMGHQRRPDGAAPLQCLPQHRSNHSPMIEVQTLKRIDRRQHLGQIGPGAVKVETNLLVFAPKPMPTECQSVSIHLIPVPKSRLNHPAPVFDLVDQS
jgi:hypothetical protein